MSSRTISSFSGTTIEELFNTPKICGGCGQKCKERDNFCIMCGTTLKVEEIDPTINYDPNYSCEGHNSDCEDCWYCLGKEVYRQIPPKTKEKPYRMRA